MPISCPDGLEVRAVEGKGRGVFATRRFRKGALLERSPVIAMPARQWRHVDRTRLGDYAYEWGKDDRGCALVLGLGSLYNHSFEPNAENHWNEPLLAMEWVALRAIAPGEEITVDYRDGEAERNPLWFRPR